MGSNHNGQHGQHWYLQRVRLFEALTEQQCETVQDSARRIDIRRRQRLHGPGDANDDLYLPKSGVVKLSVVSPEGREIILVRPAPARSSNELADAVSSDPPVSSV